MNRLVSNDRLSGAQPIDRQMVPGAGLIITGVASVLLWAVIAALFTVL